MNIPIAEVTLYKRNVNTKTLDTTGTVLTHVQNIDVRVGVETIKDVFSFTVPNHYISSTNTWNRPIGKKTTSSNFIAIGDLIKIKAYNTTADSTELNNVLIVGEVTNFRHSEASNGNAIVVEGTNITENLLRGYALSTYVNTPSADSDDVRQSASAILLDVVTRRLRYAGITPEKKIYAALEGQPITDTIPEIGTNINITGTNGHVRSTSKVITYSKLWQPAYKIIEDLSTPDNTGDNDTGNYVFYVEPVAVLPQYISALKTSFVYELHWGPPSETTLRTLTVGVDYNKITTTKNVDELVNALIIKPGTTPSGKGIVTWAANTQSMGENGPKYSYFAKPEIGNKIKSDEKRAGENLGSTFTGFTPDETNSENGSSQYPWVLNTIFDRNTQYPFTEQSTHPTASDVEEYDEVFFSEIKNRGKIEGQNIVDKLGVATYTTQVELTTGSNDLTMGTIIGIKDKPFGWDDTTNNPVYRLRIRDIRHRLDAGGWSTTLVTKEDEKIISERINTW